MKGQLLLWRSGVLPASPTNRLTWAFKHERHGVSIICCLHGHHIIVSSTLEDLGQVA
jgi:hypothetical protein